MKIDKDNLSNDINTKEIRLVKLNIKINEIRDILNDICCTLEENEDTTERLVVSRYLDELILEFIREINKI